ncbi:MAG: hypothetical protein FWE45_01755 [Firmicutes bacterium]|nr:hypothetical protein [Bacillota bacterium]
MLNENIFYLDAKNRIVDFLNDNFDDFPIKLQNRFLNFFPKMVNYEEEGAKYRPRLLFTNDIDKIMRSLPSPSKIELFRDTNEHMFASRLKALVPFTKHDWCIYINSGEIGVSYGIFKNINSIKEEGLEDIIFKSQYLRDRDEKVFGIYAYPENAWAITMKSIKGNEINVNFALDIKVVNDLDEEINEFVEASFSKLKASTKKANEVKTMYKNIFKNVVRNIHGTICVVVDKDYPTSEHRDDFLEDGIWLKEPISFSKLYIQGQHNVEPKLTAIANVFMSMLELDGITVVDNAGNILAYNVFVEANLRTSGGVIGGARKRAAYTIINSRKKLIIGVYFQSHDGEMFYAPLKK